MNAPAYNFAYLDEQTKRMIRRAILKAIAIPGYQVPFASREMPMPYGWGTGGVQVTASIIGPSDILKVIDQGADDAFLSEQLRPGLLQAACDAANQPLQLRLQSGYDHSYWFIQTFIEDHLRHHAQVLCR